MSDADWRTIPAVMLAGTSLSLGDFLRGLHRHGRLLSWLRDAAIEQFLLDEAKQAGLTTTTEELQRAADGFRQRQGLHSTDAMENWLKNQRLCVVDFEETLERDLVVAKFKDHVTRDLLPGHFAANRADYERVTLRHILVGREDLARELAIQIRDEGQDFEELARRHSMDLSRTADGALGTRLRRELPTGIAAAIAAAPQGEVVGPVAMPQGFHLVLVENVQCAELDMRTTAAIREELFANWLSSRLAGAPVILPLLDVLESF